MNITVSKKKLKDIDAELYVIPVTSDAETGGAVRELSEQDRQLVAARVETSHFQAKAGKTLSVQTASGDILLVGVGGDRDAETFRRVAAKSLGAAAAVRAKTVVISAGSGTAAKKHVAPLIEGYLLGKYRFDKYKAKEDDSYGGPESLVIAGSLPPGYPIHYSPTPAPLYLAPTYRRLGLAQSTGSVPRGLPIPNCPTHSPL